MAVCITHTKLCKNPFILSTVGKMICPVCNKPTMVVNMNPTHCTKCGAQLPELVGFMSKSNTARLYYHVAQI
jgi:hypothetical protein